MSSSSIYNYFDALIRGTSDTGLSEEELNHRVDELYAQFKSYLVAEFSERVGIGSEHRAQFKDLAAKSDQELLMNEISLLARQSTNKELEIILVEILNSFIKKNFT